MVLQIGVIGPTGFGGSYLCIELLNRGQSVRGISRRPERLGIHQSYTPYTIDIESASIEQLVTAFTGLDILVNEYGPHTSGEHALQYSQSLPHATSMRLFIPMPLLTICLRLIRTVS